MKPAESINPGQDEVEALTQPQGTLNVLALCGSLRARSVNRALLQALAQGCTELTLFEGLRDLPLFNPDDEEKDFPAVTAFRRALQAADAVVIACPEYAHGLPGAFKNALDWVVGSAEFDGKMTLLLTASRRSHHAPAQLIEVLRTMGAKCTEATAFHLPSDPVKVAAALAEPETARQLAQVRAELLNKVRGF